MNMQYFTVSAVFQRPEGSGVRPYGLVGGGVYYRPVQVTTEELGFAPGFCDPFWYVCYPGQIVPVEDVIGERSSTDFGMDFGGGVNFGTFYTELRYHYIWGPTVPTVGPVQPLPGVSAEREGERAVPPVHVRLPLLLSGHARKNQVRGPLPPGSGPFLFLLLERSRLLDAYRAWRPGVCRAAEPTHAMSRRSTRLRASASVIRSAAPSAVATPAAASSPSTATLFAAACSRCNAVCDIPEKRATADRPAASSTIRQIWDSRLPSSRLVSRRLRACSIAGFESTSRSDCSRDDRGHASEAPCDWTCRRRRA